MSRLMPIACWSAAALTIVMLIGSAGIVAPALTSMNLAARGAAPSYMAGTPEAVLTAVVTARGDRYAGDCATTRSPQDIGAVCSGLIAERDGLRAYLLGRTFSEFSWWLFVAQEGTAWHAIGTAPLDFLDLGGTIPWPSEAVAIP